METTNLVIFKSAKHLVFWELWTTEQVHKTNSINLFYKCKKVNTWNEKWPFLMFAKTVSEIMICYFKKMKNKIMLAEVMLGENYL